MSQQRVKIAIKAGEVVRFPAACVHCQQAATGRMPLRRRQGQVTRQIDVPLCAECQRELQRLSGAEERWRQLGWLAAALAFLVLVVVLFLLSPAAFPFLLRLLIAVILAALGAGAVWLAFQRTSLRHARPDKLSIVSAADLAAFSWQESTFEFANEEFAEQFRRLNESHLVS